MNEDTLKGKNIILRKPIESDILDRYNYGKIPEIIRMYGGDTRNIKPYTIDDAHKWYNNIADNPNVWHIEFEGHYIGGVRLTINEVDKRARYAIGIQDPTKLGMGLGTEVTMLMLDYVFNKLYLHKIDLRVLEYNTRAINCYKKCGFIIEGIDREGALIEDKWESDFIMSILEDEYRNQFS